ncbi:MAG: hypothetical protein VX899_24235 [Myxococcota bacterium]|nr:hypothetical protein [Myxococcota bacterium]
MSLPLMFTLALGLACGGESEPAPKPPSWEQQWQAEHGAQLGPHLERWKALQTAFAGVKGQKDTQVIEPLAGTVVIGESALLVTDGALLDPSLDSGKQPTISLVLETNPRLDQLHKLSAGQPTSPFFMEARADSLLRSLDAAQVVIVAAVDTFAFPHEAKAEETFEPGAYAATLHVFDYLTAAYHGRVQVQAMSSARVEVDQRLSGIALQQDLTANAEEAIFGGLRASFPQIRTAGSR